MDRHKYADVRFDMVPPYEEKVLSREGETENIQRANGVISRALVAEATEGMRASMDEYRRPPCEVSAVVVIARLDPAYYKRTQSSAEFSPKETISSALLGVLL